MVLFSGRGPAKDDKRPPDLADAAKKYFSAKANKICRSKAPDFAF